MSFQIDIADLSSITDTGTVSNNSLLAWHGGRLIDPIILFRTTPLDPWELRDGGTKLERYRTLGFENIIAHDDSRNNDLYP